MVDDLDSTISLRSRLDDRRPLVAVFVFAFALLLMLMSLREQVKSALLMSKFTVREAN